MREGMIWLLGAFCNDGADTVMDLVVRMGVVRPMAGRLSSAGLMSGMAPSSVACGKRALRDAEMLS